MSVFALDYTFVDQAQEYHLTSSVSITDPAPGTSPGAGAAAMAWSSSATSPIVVPDGVVPPPAYLGCLRIPTQGIFETVSSYGGLAGRNDNGTIKLYIVSNEGGDEAFRGKILEFIDPGSGYSLDYTTAPIISMTTYSNEYRSKRFTWMAGIPGTTDDFSTSLCIPGGLYWHEGNQRLYNTFIDTYDVTSRQTHGLLSIRLNANLTTTGFGPWSIQATTSQNETQRGPRACISIQRHPSTGQLMAGSTFTSGNKNCTWGPSYFTGANFPSDSTAVGENELINLPIRGLRYYFMGFSVQNEGYALTTTGELLPGKSLKSFRRRLTPGPFEYFGETTCGPADDVLNVNPALYSDALGATGSWRDNDFVNGPMFIQIGTKAVYLYAATLVTGHSWYANDCKPQCNHGIDAVPPGITGPTSTGYMPALIGYDPATITSVQNSVIQDWEAEPAWCINCETEFPGFRAAPEATQGGAKHLALGYFDTATRKLFCVSHRADGTRSSLPCGVPNAQCGSLLHVFQFPAS